MKLVFLVFLVHIIYHPPIPTSKILRNTAYGIFFCNLEIKITNRNLLNFIEISVVIVLDKNAYRNISNLRT